MFFTLMLLMDIVFVLTIGLALDKWAKLDYMPDLDGLEFFVTAVLIAPLLEELIFRAGLRAPIYSLYIGPILMILVGGATLWQLSLGLIATILVLAFGAHLYVERRKRKRGMQTNFFIARQYVQHYPKVFWLYACAFSLVHIVKLWDQRRERVTGDFRRDSAIYCECIMGLHTSTGRFDEFHRVACAR